MILLLLGCVPPGVYGMRFDGSMPQTTEFAAVGGLFPGSQGEDVSLADTTVAGLQVRQRLGRDVAVELAGGVAPASASGNLAGAAELEVQGRILRDAPVTLAVTGGLDVYGQVDAESLLWGVDVGAVVSRQLPGDLRPYFGVKVNPMIQPGDGLYPWLQYGGGLSWRPRLEESTRGLLALEASGYHGFSANVLDDSDIVTWGLMLEVGASFGSGRAEE
jgi:hypothetical protein